MPPIYFLLGMSLLSLVVVLSFLSEEKDDKDGIKMGKPPEGTDRLTHATAAATGRNANAPAGIKEGA